MICPGEFRRTGKGVYGIHKLREVVDKNVNHPIS